MAGTRNERRKGVRLTSKQSVAAGFKGEGSATLPRKATVADLSEGGVRLLFDWAEGTQFPLRVGDGLGFQLSMEGTQQTFEIWSIIRRVETRDRSGRVGAGVEFSGLDADTRSALQKSMLALAMTKLRSWQTEPGAEAPKAAKPAQGGPAAAAAVSGAAAGAPADAAKPSRRKLFLGDILLRQGAVDPEKMKNFLTSEFTGKRKIGQELVEHGLTTESAVAKALAEQARLPFIDSSTPPPDMGLVARLPRPVFIKHRCVPLREENGAVLLAFSSPPDLPTLEEIRGAIDRRVRLCIAPDSLVAEWRKRLYNVNQQSTSSGLRFPAQLRTEYNFLDRERKNHVGDGPHYGLTKEISAAGLMIAGPLPAGVTPKRVSDEGLVMEVQVDCPSLSVPLTMICVPEHVTSGSVDKEHHFSCRIEAFPPGGEQAWVRVCMTQGTYRFRPQARGH